MTNNKKPTEGGYIHSKRMFRDINSFLGRCRKRDNQVFYFFIET